MPSRAVCAPLPPAAPRIDYILEQQAFVAVDNGVQPQPETISKFLSDPVHKAMQACSDMRPSVDFSVGGDTSSVGVGAGAARTEFRSTVAAS